MLLLEWFYTIELPCPKISVDILSVFGPDEADIICPHTSTERKILQGIKELRFDAVQFLLSHLYIKNRLLGISMKKRYFIVFGAYTVRCGFQVVRESPTIGTLMSFPSANLSILITPVFIIKLSTYRFITFYFKVSYRVKYICPEFHHATRRFHFHIAILQFQLLTEICSIFKRIWGECQTDTPLFQQRVILIEGVAAAYIE